MASHLSSRPFILRCIQLSKNNASTVEKRLSHVVAANLSQESSASPLSIDSSKTVLTRCHNQFLSHHLQNRTLFNIPQQFQSNKRKEYSERRLLGYSMEQMYEIVADVSKYPEFVPWCKQAVIFENRNNGFKARLEVGFPPVKERYVSTVKLVRPNLVHAECSEGKLFSQLVNLWKFAPGIPGNPKTCTLDFAVMFEFRSQLHSKLATMFFDEIVRTMVNSFLKRAESLHGPECIRSQKPKILVHSS